MKKRARHQARRKSEPPKFHDGLSNVWAAFAAGALGRYESEVPNRVAADEAARDADDLMRHFLKRFPNESPRGGDG